MNPPPAPRSPEVGPRPWPIALLTALVVAAAAVAVAQDEPSGKAAGDAARAQEPPPAPASKGFRPEPELWSDPNRLELLEVDSFPELPTGVMTATDERNFEAMMQGRSAPNADLIRRYVARHAAELARHNNLNPLVAPDSNDPESQKARTRAAKAMEAATQALLNPLLQPATASTQGFRRAYAEALREVAPRLLSGHLHTRTFFMVVLSRTQAPELLPTLVESLEDPDQPLMVKLLAAVGIANTARGRSLDPANQAIPAANALSGFLADNPDAFWPAKWRALEALGTLRVATAAPLRGQAELAVEPFRLLADPAEKIDVRAWAAWALGMLLVPGQVQNYNYELVAYEVGQAAVAAGEQVLGLPLDGAQASQNLRLVRRLGDPILRLLSALAGDPDIARSGLSNATHPSVASAQPMIRGVEQRVRALARSTLALSNAAGAQIRDARRRVVADVDELRSYLAKNPPKSDALFPGGPQVELPSAARKGAEPRKGAAGAAGGR